MAIMTRELSAACRLGRGTVEAGRAREMARKALPWWGIAEHTGLAELIVSELVTNAVRPAEGPIEVRLRRPVDRSPRPGTGRPILQHATTDDEQGRGLFTLTPALRSRSCRRPSSSDAHRRPMTPKLNDKPVVGWPGGVSPPGSHRIRT
jgi:hypothetical protein